MTILNIHMKKEDKKEIQDFVNSKKIKSVSEFVRKIMAERLEMEKQFQDFEDEKDFKIPEYIPKNKFIAIVKGSIVAVGETPSEVSQIAITKFPNLPIKIKFSGPKKFKPPEFIFMSLSKLNCWKYFDFEDELYPIIPIKFKHRLIDLNLSAIIDTAATLCILKKGLVLEEELELVRQIDVSTASGIVKSDIYSGNVEILDCKFKIEFLVSPISDFLPFQFLIGHNLMNKLDTYFFGKKKIVCIKKSE